MKCEYGGVPRLIADGVLAVGDCQAEVVGFFEEQSLDGRATAARRAYCQPHADRLLERGRYGERGLQLIGPFAGLWGTRMDTSTP